MVIAETLCLLLVDDSRFFRLVNPVSNIVGLNKTFFLCLPEFRLEWRQLLGQDQLFLQQPDGIAWLNRRIGLCTESFPRLTGMRNHVNNLAAKFV